MAITFDEKSLLKVGPGDITVNLGTEFDSFEIMDDYLQIKIFGSYLLCTVLYSHTDV